MSNTPLINLLIRTSNRPKSFARCLASVQNQNYGNLNILVSADNEGTAEYVRAHGIEPVMVRKDRNPLVTGPYNLYLNTLLEQVKDGWILILDDDDHLAPESLTRLSSSLIDAMCPVFVRMEWPNGRVIPEEEYWMYEPQRKHIGMPCIVFHHKLKNLVKFDGMKGADFRLANKFWKLLNIIWKDLVVVNVGNTGNGGRPIDI